MDRLHCRIGALELKNPLIAAAGEHMIDASGVERAIRAGAGAVVVKSTNESQAAKDQLLRAEYMAFGPDWRPADWGPDAPADVTLASRSGLAPQAFDQWLSQAVALDKVARQHDCLLVASLILADLDQAEGLARQVEQAGLRALEFNIGTPYASQAAKGAVSTELLPERVRMIVSRIRATVSLPLAIKLTGQSERVPELAEAAFDSGANSVVMAGRLLGFVPDVETLDPFLGTSLAVGGYWNLPLTCQWLALTRARLGRDAPLVGINGAQSGLDIARMLLSGASAVGMASAVMMRGYAAITESLADLDRWLAEKDLTAIEAIGISADRRKSFAEMPLIGEHWRKFIPA